MRPRSPQVNKRPVNPNSPDSDLKSRRDDQKPSFRIRDQDIRGQADQVLRIRASADLSVVCLAPIAGGNTERDADELPGLIQKPHERVAYFGSATARTGELADAEVHPLFRGHWSNSPRSLLLLPGLMGGLSQVQELIQGRGCSRDLGNGCKDGREHEEGRLVGELVEDSVKFVVDLLELVTVHLA